jgi:hypothetical protein
MLGCALAIELHVSPSFFGCVIPLSQPELLRILLLQLGRREDLGWDVAAARLVDLFQLRQEVAVGDGI